MVEDGRPIAAGIFVPVEDALLLAAAGERRDPQRQPGVRHRPGAALEGARIAGPKRFLDRLSAKSTSEIVAGAANPLAGAAACPRRRGRIDAAFASVNAHDWDLAAADLLVHEAGGALTTLAGEKLVYNLHDPVHGAVLAAGRARHAALLDLLRDRRADFA